MDEPAILATAALLDIPLAPERARSIAADLTALAARLRRMQPPALDAVPADFPGPPA